MKYVSELKELSGKVYDTVADLEAAEAKANEAIAEKQKKASAKKEAASLVDQSIVERDRIFKENAKKRQEAYKAYLAICDECDKADKEANNKTYEAIKDFCEKYPEGYHSTVKFDDGSMRTFSYRTNTPSCITTWTDLFDRTFGNFLR